MTEMKAYESQTGNTSGGIAGVGEATIDAEGNEGEEEKKLNAKTSDRAMKTQGEESDSDSSSSEDESESEESSSPRSTSNLKKRKLQF
jgi:hypothetical protein